MANTVSSAALITKPVRSLGGFYAMAGEDLRRVDRRHLPTDAYAMFTTVLGGLGAATKLRNPESSAVLRIWAAVKRG